MKALNEVAKQIARGRYWSHSKGLCMFFGLRGLGELVNVPAGRAASEEVWQEPLPRPKRFPVVCVAPGSAQRQSLGNPEAVRAKVIGTAVVNVRRSRLEYS